MVQALYLPVSEYNPLTLCQHIHPVIADSAVDTVLMAGLPGQRRMPGLAG